MHRAQEELELVQLRTRTRMQDGKGHKRKVKCVEIIQGQASYILYGCTNAQRVAGGHGYSRMQP